MWNLKAASCGGPKGSFFVKVGISFDWLQCCSVNWIIGIDIYMSVLHVRRNGSNQAKDVCHICDLHEENMLVVERFVIVVECLVKSQCN